MPRPRKVSIRNWIRNYSSKSHTDQRPHRRAPTSPQPNWQRRASKPLCKHVTGSPNAATSTHERNKKKKNPPRPRKKWLATRVASRSPYTQPVDDERNEDLVLMNHVRIHGLSAFSTSIESRLMTCCASFFCVRFRESINNDWCTCGAFAE